MEPLLVVSNVNCDLHSPLLKLSIPSHPLRERGCLQGLFMLNPWSLPDLRGLTECLFSFKSAEIFSISVFNCWLSSMLSNIRSHERPRLHDCALKLSRTRLGNDRGWKPCAMGQRQCTSPVALERHAQMLWYDIDPAPGMLHVCILRGS